MHDGRWPVLADWADLFPETIGDDYNMMHHGEYKMPGGKLVVVDLEVVAGKLATVQVSGDFFLEPDSALALFNQALEGQRSDADVVTLVAAIQAALPDDVQMYGIDAEAVAIAVRRALDGQEQSA